MTELGLAFGPDDLALMQRVRAVFDPEGRANPGKIFPTPGVCIEQRTPRRQAAL
jgi:glycolate oxidase